MKQRKMETTGKEDRKVGEERRNNKEEEGMTR